MEAETQNTGLQSNTNASNQIQNQNEFLLNEMVENNENLTINPKRESDLNDMFNEKPQKIEEIAVNSIYSGLSYISSYSNTSILGSIFNLFILTLGTGCLTLPQKVGYMSIVISIIVIILSGLANLWTFILLAELCIKKHIRSYSKLVNEIYGKNLSILLDVVTILNQYGIILVYQVIIYRIIGNSLFEFGLKKNYKNIDDFYSTWNSKKYSFPINFSITTIILLPLCLLKNISKMRFGSVLGIFSSFLLVLIILVQSPKFIKKADKSQYKILDFSVISHGIENFFKSFATLFYAYSCQISSLPVLDKLYKPSRKRIYQTYTITFICAILFYLIIAIVGYLSYPVNTPDLFIDRKIDGVLSNDIAMTIGKILFCVTLLTKIPVDYVSIRISIFNLIRRINNTFNENEKQYHIEDEKNFFWKNLGITALIIYSSTLISILYRNVTNYMSLIGSFCSVAVSFLIPGLLYIKENTDKYKKTHWKIICTYILTTLLSLIGVASGILTIISMIKE